VGSLDVGRKVAVTRRAPPATLLRLGPGAARNGKRPRSSSNVNIRHNRHRLSIVVINLKSTIVIPSPPPPAPQQRFVTTTAVSYWQFPPARHPGRCIISFLHSASLHACAHHDNLHPPNSILLQHFSSTKFSSLRCFVMVSRQYYYSPDIVLPWMSYLFLTSWFCSDILLIAPASSPWNNLNVTPPHLSLLIVVCVAVVVAHSHIRTDTGVGRRVYGHA